jgi:X breakpoint 2-interacting protein
LQQVRIQQTHELKKKEKEFIKLQERLIQVLQEKKKESKTGMEIMNLLQKEGRQRGTWLNKKADGDFYKMISLCRLMLMKPKNRNSLLKTQI